MPTERSLAYWRRVQWWEGLVLLLAAPLLLFPERFTLLTTLALTALAALWFAPILVARSPLIPSTPHNAALLLFCLTLGVGILVTADPDLTLSKASGVILGLAVWRYLILAVRQRVDLEWAVGAYVLSGLGFVVTGLLNANWILKATSRVPVLGEILSQRAAAALFLPLETGIHPNQIAGTITLLLPLLVALSLGSKQLFSVRRGLARWAIVAITLFCGVALLLTQSRSGWVGLLGGLLVLFALWGLLMEPSRNRRLVLAGTGILIALALLLLLALGPQRIQQLWLDPPQETAVGSLTTINFRQQLWPWALQAISDFPFTGTGLGTFRQVSLRLYPVLIPPTFEFGHAHNVFLQVALDLGIPGLIAYGAILLVSVVVAWQLAKQDRYLRPIGLGILASLAAFHLFGLADALALGSKSAVLIWALFGLLAAMANLR